MSKHHVAAIALFGLFCTAASALAHHSFAAEFDASEAIKFENGTILKIPGGGGQYEGDDADQILDNVK